MPTPDPHPNDRKWTAAGALVVTGFLLLSLFAAFILLPVAQAPAAGIDAWSAICRAVGLTPGVPGWRQPQSATKAQPVSQVSWSPETLDIIGKADQGAGAQLAAQVCVNCHGEDGVSSSGEFPNLAGQSAAAIYKQLSDYRSGVRTHPQMTGVSQQLTEPQLAQIAAYYARGNVSGSMGQRWELPDPETARLVNRGDPHRGIPACNSCHGQQVGGPIETPTLTGQREEYIARQLRLYRSGERSNDVYRRMRDISAKLTDAEIDRLAAYYQGLR